MPRSGRKAEGLMKVLEREDVNFSTQWHSRGFGREEMKPENTKREQKERGSGGWGNKNLRCELSSASDDERREQKERCHYVTQSGEDGMLLRGSPSTLSFSKADSQARLP
ncbi:hypothetical protein DFH09DRAFT_1067548 [Mycena vulgaris]|nr:hypothetical protein DFH09DRAFT_1067548 [Mycena vulgaris]